MKGVYPYLSFGDKRVRSCPTGQNLGTCRDTGQEPSDDSGKTPDDYLTIAGNFSGLKIGGLARLSGGSPYLHKTSKLAVALA
jgi:hypothetical protein